MRELDQKNMLNGDVIDGIMLEEKKEVDKVIISSQELSQYFGKDKTPREMKDQILKLLDEWKGKQKEIGRIDRRELGFICLSGLATGGSWLCYYKALQDGLASVVVPIDKLSILVTIAFSYLVFHEKLTKKAAFGLVLIVAGTLLMIL